MITGRIIGNYAVARGFWTEQQETIWLEKVEQCLESELRGMGTRWKSYDKGMIAITALGDALRSGKIVPVRLDSETCQKRYSFYEDDRFFYLQTKYFKLIVNEYCHHFGERMEILNEAEMVGLLERKGVLDVLEKDGNKKEASRKLPIQKGNTLRYMYISKLKLLQYEEF